MNRKLHEITLGLVGAIVLMGAGETASAEEVVHDFRGSKSLGKNFRPEGPNSHQYITPEPEGLRWRFVPGEAPTRPVGIYWSNWVHGDFVATVRYEIVEAAPTANSNGIGPEMYLMLDTPERDGVAFALLLQSTTVPSFRFIHLSNNEQGKRITKNRYVHPAPAGSEQRGRMRLAREGTTLIVSIAAGDEEAMQEIHRADIGDTAIRMVRFAGVNGGDATAKLDMRLLEFRIEGKQIGPVEDVAVAVPAQDPAAPAPERPRIWRYWGVGIVATLFLAGAVTVLKRRMRPAAPSNPAAGDRLSSPAVVGERRGGPSESIQTKADANAGMIGFTCSGCGKNLKVKPDWAGKRVKCPECGHSITAPSVISANGR